VRVWPLVM
ncbi:bacterial extracellular solute-binding s, 3 family protein, partial [Vibrio parahaemolyticus VP2007-007]